MTRRDDGPEIEVVGAAVAPDPAPGGRPSGSPRRRSGPLRWWWAAVGVALIWVTAAVVTRPRPVPVTVTGAAGVPVAACGSLTAADVQSASAVGASSGGSIGDVALGSEVAFLVTSTGGPPVAVRRPGAVEAIEVTSAELRWRWPMTDGPVERIVIAGDVALTVAAESAGRSRVVALDAASGRVRWTVLAATAELAAPIPVGGDGGDRPSDAVLLRAVDDRLVAVDLVDGAVRWGSPTASAAFGGAVVGRGLRSPATRWSSWTAARCVRSTRSAARCAGHERWERGSGGSPSPVT